ncbi:MAG: lipid A biosynthesis acyltransferase [Burkholderiales bacterium]|nr:lipid A biosynthesis acyltransferase [Burkholderiales bacterium]
MRAQVLSSPRGNGVARALFSGGVGLLVGGMWLVHRLPLPVLSRIGSGLGSLLFLLARERRAVCEINLERCFPDMDPARRSRLAREHFRVLTRALLERGLLWWAPRARLLRLVRVEGREHLDAARKGPVIVLAPHFVALDAGGTRLGCDLELAALYARQKSALMDRMLRRGRSRFLPSRLISRQEGIRPAVTALREGLPLYYLPDQDYGPRDSIFVPFFGVPAATITGLARLARVAGASVVPCVSRMLPGGAGYVTRFYPAWRDFPSGDVGADTRRMNAFIEERVLEMPEQYNWAHKRFKTRPQGEARWY